MNVIECSLLIIRDAKTKLLLLARLYKMDTLRKRYTSLQNSAELEVNLYVAAWFASGSHILIGFKNVFLTISPTEILKSYS